MSSRSRIILVHIICIIQLYYDLNLTNDFFFFYRIDRIRNDGSFIKANCSAVATIRELPSSKENRSNNRPNNHNHGIKSGQVTARMTETCDGHTPRHRAPLPPSVEVSYLSVFFLNIGSSLGANGGELWRFRNPALFISKIVLLVFLTIFLLVH